MNLPGFDAPVRLLIEKVVSLLPPDVPAYLVGGAVRDMLLGKSTHDLDFSLARDAIQIGRSVASRLGAAFYPLDPVRDAGRLIITKPPFERYVIDFTSWRAPNLTSDLRDRDFTINAIALDIRNPEHLIDPLKGAADLLAGIIRLCTPVSLINDPVRILRLARLSVDLNLKIPGETRKKIQPALEGLKQASPERLRDELFKMLEGRSPASSIRLLDQFGALAILMPELMELKGIRQPTPHMDDVWNHSLAAVQKLANILKVLAPHHDPQEAANWAYGLVSLRLGRFREALHSHLSVRLNPERSLRSLLYLATLYHDSGKPGSYQLGENREIHFYGHDQNGAGIIRKRGAALRLSNAEIDKLSTIVRHHMRPKHLAQDDSAPSRRAIYRFFRDTGEVGVDICLISLADRLAAYGAALPQDKWISHLDTVRALLEAWWERRNETITPPPLINGDDLIEQFHLEPSPIIGKLLEELREAQAAGELHTRSEALDFSRRKLDYGKMTSSTG